MSDLNVLYFIILLIFYCLYFTIKMDMKERMKLFFLMYKTKHLAPGSGSLCYVIFVLCVCEHTHKSKHLFLPNSVCATSPG